MRVIYQGFSHSFDVHLSVRMQSSPVYKCTPAWVGGDVRFFFSQGTR